MIRLFPKPRPSEIRRDDDTDAMWEKWGREDPYYSVMTNSIYRRSELTEKSKATFFESGKTHVEGLMRIIRLYVAPHFAPQTILDFGCGVGRTLIPFSRLATSVLGLDVSPAMLLEARHNCDDQGAANVRLELSDDALTCAKQTFDLVHSAIVLQHIPTERGKLLFRRLLDLISPGGVGALQVLYSKRAYAESNGLAPAIEIEKRKWYQRSSTRPVEPTPNSLSMQMNPYHMNELLFFMQARGVQQFHAKFTDHDGELGLFYFFAVPY